MDCAAHPFLKTAMAAFPADRRALAAGAAEVLSPFVDATYHSSSVEVVVRGERVHIPRRIHFVGLRDANLKMQPALWPAIQCLCTRSTDGRERQAALKSILTLSEPWSIPFVVLPAGEYVVEIIDDMVASLPAFDREAYIAFVRENRGLMRLLRAKATSYWNRGHRISHSDRSNYPGLVFLHRFETWAG